MDPPANDRRSIDDDVEWTIIPANDGTDCGTPPVNAEKDPCVSVGDEPDIRQPGNVAKDSDPVGEYLQTKARSKDPFHLRAGDRYHDFLIQSELGRGAIGVVYLAQQVSLSRNVALKISPSASTVTKSEGSLLARLDHASIVRVYSESTDIDRGAHLLCMQYVPGITMAHWISEIQARFGNRWTGSQVLEILDDSIEDAGGVGASAFRDRGLLENANRGAAICFIGSQLAFALEHSHQQKTIHGDIKPANIIVNRFGRPRLIDFNLSRPTEQRRHLGYTPAYVAPELLIPPPDRRASAEDQSIGKRTDGDSTIHRGMSADLFSLSVVLWELATGQSPFPPLAPEISAKDLDGKLSQRDAARLSGSLTIERFEQSPVGGQSIPPHLRSVLERSLSLHPSARLKSAGEFGRTLQGVALQARAIAMTDRRANLGSLFRRHPRWSLLLAGLIPYLVASSLQITYNISEIVPLMSQASAKLFYVQLILLNFLLYGASITYCYVRLSQLISGLSQSIDQREHARESLMALPAKIATLGTFNWAFAAIGFPATIHLMADPLSLDIWIHFFFSFLFSGAIAVIYGYALMTSVIVLGIYCVAHGRMDQFRKHAVDELLPLRNRFGPLAIAAGAIPQLAAILLVWTHPFDSGDTDGTLFKTLVVALIVSGSIGFASVGFLGRVTSRVIDRIRQPDLV